MDITIIIGVISIVSLLVHSIGIESFMLLFFHVDALILVLGCTFAATLIHFPITQFIRLFRRIAVLFSFRRYNYQKDIDFLTNISKSIRENGIQSIIPTVNSCNDHFIKTGLQLLIDNIHIDELESTLKQNITYIQKRHLQGILFFDQMAKYAPAFGLLGTTIGLIQLLSNLKDPRMIGQGMSIALVSTFYGIILANFFFSPTSGRLRSYSIEESLQKEMLMIGILSVAKNEPSAIVKEKMMLFLTKKERGNGK